MFITFESKLTHIIEEVTFTGKKIHQLAEVSVLVR